MVYHFKADPNISHAKNPMDALNLLKNKLVSDLAAVVNTANVTYAKFKPLIYWMAKFGYAFKNKILLKAGFINLPWLTRGDRDSGMERWVHNYKGFEPAVFYQFLLRNYLLNTDHYHLQSNVMDKARFKTELNTWVLTRGLNLQGLWLTLPSTDHLERISFDYDDATDILQINYQPLAQTSYQTPDPVMLDKFRVNQCVDALFTNTGVCFGLDQYPVPELKAKWDELEPLFKYQLNEKQKLPELFAK